MWLFRHSAEAEANRGTFRGSGSVESDGADEGRG